MSDLTTKAAEIRAGLVADWRKAMEGVPAGEWQFTETLPRSVYTSEGPDVRMIARTDVVGSPTSEANAVAAWIARCSPAGIAALLALIEQQAAELAEARAERNGAHRAGMRLGAQRNAAEAERDSWRCVAERLETEKQALAAERAELLREKERLGAGWRAESAGDEEVEALRRGLVGVTPGPWSLIVMREIEGDDESGVVGWSPASIEGDDGNPVCLFGDAAGSGTLFENIADHAHLLRCSPDAIQRLITRLDTAKATVGRLGEALAKLVTTAKLLYANSEGCAVNHYCDDFAIHGLPGWFADCAADIEAASSALENDPAGLADAHSKSPAPTSQSERIAVLGKALRLAKEMFIANGLDLPHTMEVIDAALASLGEE